MEEGFGFFDAWLKSQRKFLENWIEATKNLQQTFFTLGGTKGGTTDTARDVFSLYHSWIRTVGKSFDEIMKSYPLSIGKDTFSKIFSGADAYMKLYEFWTPILKAFEERSFAPESYKDLLDPSKYKDVIDKVFGFSSPDTITEFYGQASKIIETWGSSAQQFVKPWAEAIQKNTEAFPDIVSGKTEASLNMFHNLYSAFENTFGKVFKMPPIGKDREKIELMMKSLDKYSVYMAKNTEFQHSIYVAGEKAMEKVLNAISQKIKEGAEIKSYDEFFKLWTDTNEEEYFELFKSEEFSKLQGQLLDAALDTRRHFQKITEMFLEDFPVPVRSEMDDVYKTIYDLKKKVIALEKKTRSLEATKEVTP